MKTPTRSAVAAVCSLALTVCAAGAPPETTVPDKSATEAAEMKAQLQHVRDAVNSAKKAGDLDPVLFDLQKYQNNGFGNGLDGTFSPENQQLYQQMNSALEFTRQWQNYLSHAESGQTDQARNDLSTLAQANYGIGIIPRSRILALLAGQQAPPVPVQPSAPEPVSDAQKIIDGITTLADLESALRQLNALPPQDQVARQYAEQLSPMVEVYLDLKNGLPTNVSINFMGDVTGPGVSAKANSLLLKFILQHYFDTYKGDPPRDDETPAAYAIRVKNDALSGQDWALLKKALTAYSYLYRNVAIQGGMPDNEAAGLDDMITGLNQQDAGQYELAVGSFQHALKASNTNLPAKFIGEQLDKIKHDHPSEYDSGMETFLSPPAPQFYPGMNPAFFNQPFRPGMPGVPASQPTQPNSDLTIPGKPTIPAAPTTASTNAPPATK